MQPKSGLLLSNLNQAIMECHLPKIELSYFELLTHKFIILFIPNVALELYVKALGDQENKTWEEAGPKHKPDSY